MKKLILSSGSSHCIYKKILKHNKKYKPMKMIIVLFLFWNNFLFSQLNYLLQDTTKEKPVQYRRGVELKEGYQTYNEKYSGKKLDEEKRRLFPLREGTGVWTELNPKVPRVTYIGVHFVNAEIGWAVGDLGALIKTTDGGNSWSVIETNTTAAILKVTSYNGQVVIASGLDGLILRSTDGGETFEQVTSGVTGDLWGLQMINDTLGWACGSLNSLIKTTNGGETWQTISPGIMTHYWWIEFLDEKTGFIACSSGIVLKTTDGGINWQQHQAGSTISLYTIDAIDSLHIVAGGASGKNVYSSDGGITWLENFPLIFDDVNCIAFVDADTGYAIGLDWGIRKTTDSGVNWFASNTNIGEWHIQLLPDFYGYTAGTNLKIFKTEGWYDNWERLFLNDNFNDIYFIDEFKGFAISGTLFSTTNGGLSWEQKNIPGGKVIVFSDSLHGCIGSSYQSSTAIYKTSDGGENWFLANITGLIDTGAAIEKIFFINPTTGWAVTNRGGILKTTDAGANWFAQLNTFNFISFRGIYFIDNLNGWTSNLPRRPHKTIDGGNTWVEQTQINYTLTIDVYFKDVNNGWLLESSVLIKTSDGGLNWNPVPNITGNLFQFIFFDEPNHWMITGGNKYETTDGGENWEDVTQYVPSFNNFHSPSEGIGYACGNLGLVLKYIDTSIVPVELSSFIADVSKDKVILSWVTSTELNNKGFEIEKSQSASGGQMWEKVGFVNGFGTTTEPKAYSFIDNNISSGSYIYRLKQIDFDGSFDYSSLIEVEVGTPSEFYLSQNYPNPFNPETNIDYIISEETSVNISLYDITGRKIKELVNEKKQPGYYTIKLEGGVLSSSIYFYRLTTGSGYTAVKKLTLIK